jgi:uncharacterized membrane protein
VPSAEALVAALAYRLASYRLPVPFGLGAYFLHRACSPDRRSRPVHEGLLGPVPASPSCEGAHPCAGTPGLTIARAREGWERARETAMNTLTVWTFPTAVGADEALERLRPLAAQGLISVDDAAMVSWPESRRKPTMREVGSLTGPGALWGGFWGLLLGLIFLVPLAGLAFGAAAGAVAGSLVDVGIDDAFVKRVRAEVRPGTSALFVLSRGAAVEPVADALRDLDPRLLRSNLCEEEEQRLRAVFTEEEAPAGRA